MGIAEAAMSTIMCTTELWQLNSEAPAVRLAFFFGEFGGNTQGRRERRETRLDLDPSPLGSGAQKIRLPFPDLGDTCTLG